MSKNSDASSLQVDLEEPVLAPTAASGVEDILERSNPVQVYPLGYFLETGSE